jgi:hypothetical protein
MVERDGRGGDSKCFGGENITIGPEYCKKSRRPGFMGFSATLFAGTGGFVAIARMPAWRRVNPAAKKGVKGDKVILVRRDGVFGI